MASAGVDRRGFLTGLGAYLGATIVDSPEPRQQVLLHGGRLDSLHNDEALIRTVSQAKSGRLMQLYQLFPVLPGTVEDALARTTNLEELPSKKPELAKLDNPHRRRALPAVAAVHHAAVLSTVAESADQDTRPLWDVFARVHDDAFDARPHRDVLEIMWQNATAALIRSEGTWLSLHVPERILEQAEKLCLEYLRGDELLLLAAVDAWQFVVTTASSPGVPAAHAQKTVVRVTEACERSLPHRAVWFREFQRFCSGAKHFGETLPQQSELVIGRHHRGWRGPAMVATLMRAQLYLSKQVIAGDESRTRFWLADDSRETIALLEFWRDFASDMAELRSCASSLGLDDLAPSLASLPPGIGEVPGESPSQMNALQRATPFRMAVEENIADQVQPARAMLRVAVARRDFELLARGLARGAAVVARGVAPRASSLPDTILEDLKSAPSFDNPVWESFSTPDRDSSVSVQVIDSLVVEDSVSVDMHREAETHETERRIKRYIDERFRAFYDLFGDFEVEVLQSLEEGRAGVGRAIGARSSESLTGGLDDGGGTVHASPGPPDAHSLSAHSGTRSLGGRPETVNPFPAFDSDAFASVTARLQVDQDVIATARTILTAQALGGTRQPSINTGDGLGLDPAKHAALSRLVRAYYAVVRSPAPAP